jgi:dCTP diphosphatase
LVRCSLGDGTRYNDVAGKRAGDAAGHDYELAALMELVRKFTHEREWEKYHNPRSLILALIGELGELAELFQWLTDEESAELMNDEKKAAKVKSELADVFSYLLRLAAVTRVNLGQALEEKVRLNEERYPAHLARGNARKYTELEN